ncbi:MAG: thioesterase family protein [Erythrobacter sp.]
MSVANLLADITGKSGPTTLSNAEEWMQGRTLYGGASALVAYTHAMRSFTDLPPLQAAQIGFVAPIGPEVELKAEIMRQGRNVTQLRSEIYCEGSLALTTFLLFGAARDANAEHAAEMLEPWPGSPTENEDVSTARGPAFLKNNFELRRAQSESGKGEPMVRRWFRLKEHAELDAISAMILLGDANPPGAMRAMQRQGPISSINWSFNVLETAPQTQDGWWMSENRSEHADHGYSSERLAMWNSEGRQVMSGLQSVAIFG